jgi:hypothetical protein
MSTQLQLIRGECLIECLKQEQFSPLPINYQIIIVNFAINGFFDQLGPLNIYWIKKFIIFLNILLSYYFDNPLKLSHLDYYLNTISWWKLVKNQDFTKQINWDYNNPYRHLGLKRFFKSWSFFRIYSIFFSLKTWLLNYSNFIKLERGVWNFFFKKWYITWTCFSYFSNLKYDFNSLIFIFYSKADKIYYNFTRDLSITWFSGYSD